MSWVVLFLLGCPSQEALTPSENPTAEEAAAPEPAPLPPVTEARLSASQLLVLHADAVDAPSSQIRSQTEARVRATDLRQRALAGEDWAQLVKTHGEGPAAARGGHLGVWATGTMLDDVERAVASVQPGQIAPLVQSPFGFHVLRREAVVAIRVRHIVIHHQGAHEASSTRTLEDARERASQARVALVDGTPFSEVARSYSEGPTATSGGDLGWLSPGQFVPAFEAAALSLKPGELSPLVETPYGVHLIERTQ